jgi:hypothetical protein
MDMFSSDDDVPSRDAKLSFYGTTHLAGELVWQLANIDRHDGAGLIQSLVVGQD